MQGEEITKGKLIAPGPFQQFLVPPRLDMKPKEGATMSHTQVGQATLSGHHCSPWVWEGEEHVHLGPHEAGKFKCDSPCPPWQPGSPVGQGLVTSAPQPGVAQSLLCFLLKAGSLKGSE